MAKLTPEQLEARRANKAAKEAADAVVAQAERRVWDIEQMRDTRAHKPAYTFSVGDLVMMRNGGKMTVLEVFDGGLFYEVKSDWFEPAGECTKEKHHNSTGLWYWHDLQPFRIEDKTRVPMSKFDESRLTFSQRTMDGLIMCYYRWRLDMSPVYQRGNVWTHSQKELLIESIFENRDIGKFVIIMRPFSEDRNAPHAEILDGKQRLTTLIEFYENRFEYNGVLFNDLHWRDQIHFERYMINWAELNEKTTQRQKYEYFLKLNVAGVPQSKDHIQHVQTLLDVENAK